MAETVGGRTHSWRAVSMIGHPRPPGDISFAGIFSGVTENVSLPGDSVGSAGVGGSQTPLAQAPTIASSLGGADRDLALRLINSFKQIPDWWTLHRGSSMLLPGDGGPGREVHPDGALEPLLISSAGEVVAAVWISPDASIRHYVIPWLPSWVTILKWLAQQAIPEFSPSAARRLHANLGDDPNIQTVSERTASTALAQLEKQYQSEREQLEQSLSFARQAADQVRHDLLYGRGVKLEDAVGRVLTDAGCTVTALDDLLRRTASADRLVEFQGRRRLIEIKSATGNPSESLVGDAERHWATWPALQPNDAVEGVSLVINHQIAIHPKDRNQSAYTRDEFVRSLAIPVVTTAMLFDAWRRNDHDAVLAAVFGVSASSSDTPSPPPGTVESPKHFWRRRPRRG